MNATIRRKKLIEATLPLDAINESSAYEKCPVSVLIHGGYIFGGHVDRWLQRER